MSVRRQIASRVRSLRKAIGGGPSNESGTPIGRLDKMLQQLLSTRDTLSIVQVGANDGLLNDPINPFVRRHPGRTRLLLIEPQASVLPMLKETYADHPSATIVQCAIGTPGVSTLWTVDQAFWKDCQPGYAGNWPAYRAPTGLTSENRSHVESWAEQHYTGDRASTEVITSFTMQSRPLIEVLESSGFGFGVDLLQVDTEGSDDVVIMNSSIDQLLPTLINFEQAHLPQSRLAALTEHLKAIGYEIHDNGYDALAELRRP